MFFSGLSSEFGLLQPEDLPARYGLDNGNNYPTINGSYPIIDYPSGGGGIGGGVFMPNESPEFPNQTPIIKVDPPVDPPIVVANTPPIFDRTIITDPPNTKPMLKRRYFGGVKNWKLPEETKPVETKPVETKPVETKPVEEEETEIFGIPVKYLLFGGAALVGVFIVMSASKDK